MVKRIFVVLLALLLVGGMAFAAGSRAEDYPNKSIRCIVPFGPGGGTDVFVRTVLKYVNLPQSIGVVNVEGASGLVGAMEGLNSSNDGYTIIAHMPVDLVAFSLSGQSQIPIWSQLEQICWAVQDYNGFFTNKESGFSTAQELVAYARANPGKVAFGTVGARTLNSVNGMRIVEGLGIKDLVTLVPYDGGAQIRTAILGNHVQVSTNSIGDFRAILESGDSIPLGIIGKVRTNLLPNVPTTVELGIPDVTTPVPRGFFGPPGMARVQRDYLAGIFKAALDNPECVAELNRMFIDVRFVDGETGKRETQVIYDDLRVAFEKYMR